MPAANLRRAFGTLCIGALAAACSSPDGGAVADSNRGAPVSGMRVDLTGAGATFPYPLYSRWFNDYAQRTNVRINYQSIGSGGGIRQMIEGTVDFGATDVPMTDAELAQAGAPILHLPTVLGAVAVTYNLPDLKRPLQLSGDVLADIFLGTLTKWDDARLRALNPGVALPHTDILVVHRADGSGTSYIFSDYLAAISREWASGPGRGKDVRWPAGIGGRGNEGVAGQVKQMVGSIGYLEVVYARQNHLPVAHIRNQRGRFISPMPYEIASAAASAMDVAGAGGDLRLSLVNAAGDQAYPIASFTWLLLSPTRLGSVKTNQLVEFLRWALLDGGDLASSLGYVALPTVTATRVLDQLDTLSARASTKR
jgi:phosphate transport system substrate-binding protein